MTTALALSNTSAPSTAAELPSPRSRKASPALFSRFKSPPPTCCASPDPSTSSPSNRSPAEKQRGNISPKDQAVSNQRSFTISPSGKGLQGVVASDLSPTRSRSKVRKSMWSKKHHEVPPPVPDIPHFLNITLPFESSTDLKDNRSADDFQSPSKLHHTIKNGRSVDSQLMAHGSAPTPAAAVARKVTQQYAAEEQQLKESGRLRARALADARLTPAQVVEIVKLAGAEIKQRGLANVGILRPFRVGTKLSQVDRLAELYLLSSEPEKYDGVLSTLPPSARPGELAAPFSLGNEIAVATLGRPSATKELVRQLAYANVHDVSDFLKWSMRRLKINKADFGSQTDLAWYTDFVRTEREGAYKPTSFSEELLPRLPTVTGQLLTAVFDLAATISAHFVANAMPATRVCKIWGFWLFGRIALDKPPGDFDTFLVAWKRSTAIMEHLFMSYLRDQSVKLHSLPTRSAELIKGYPQLLEESFGAPGLVDGINAPGRAAASKALKVHLEGKNVIESSIRIRGPHELMYIALKAPIADNESSTEADDWISLLNIATATTWNKKKDESEDATIVGSEAESGLDVSVLSTSIGPAKASKLAALLTEEELRIFGIYAEEFASRRKMMGFGVQEEDEVEDSKNRQTEEAQSGGSPIDPISPATSTQSIYTSGMTSSQSFPLSSFATRKVRLSILPEDKSSSSRKSSGAKPLSSSSYENGIRKHQLLQSVSPRSHADEDSPPVDWTTFRKDGFIFESSADLTLGDAELHRSLTAGDLRETSTRDRSPSLSRKGSLTASRLRRHTSLGTMRRRGARRGSADYSHLKSPSASSGALDAAIVKPSYSVCSASVTEIDEGLISLWQDAILDPSNFTSLPSVVFAALNKTAASSLMSSAGQGEIGSPKATSGGSVWLMIEETIVQPPPTAQFRHQVPRGRSGRYRSGSAGVQDEETASIDGKRSLFAPSLRSIGASILRKRASLKKVSSFAALRRRQSGSVYPGGSESQREAIPPLPSSTSEQALMMSDGFVLVPTSSSSVDFPIATTLNSAVPPSTPPPTERAPASAPSFPQPPPIPQEAISGRGPVPVRRSSMKRTPTSSAGSGGNSSGHHVSHREGETSTRGPSAASSRFVDASST